MNSSEPRAERPGLREGYGISKDNDGLMAWPEVEAKLIASRNYWVCSTRADGRPHVAPVWGLWLDSALLFSSDPDSVKGRNLSRQPEVVIHLESGDDAVILEGRIERFADTSPEYNGFVEAYEVKYGIRLEPDPSFAYFKLRPRTALSWLESDFPRTATRWRFEGRNGT